LSGIIGHILILWRKKEQFMPIEFIMVDANGYEPIPDVEQGRGGAAALTPKEKYP
jgi:hypothetical protein